MSNIALLALLGTVRDPADPSRVRARPELLGQMAHSSARTHRNPNLVIIKGDPPKVATTPRHGV